MDLFVSRKALTRSIRGCGGDHFHQIRWTKFAQFFKTWPIERSVCNFTLVSPPGMVETPRLEAKLNLRNGRLILRAFSFRIGAEPTMSMLTRMHQNCHSGENRNLGVVPANAGNHLILWIPIFIGSPGFLLPQE